MWPVRILPALQHTCACPANFGFLILVLSPPSLLFRVHVRWPGMTGTQSVESVFADCWPREACCTIFFVQCDFYLHCSRCIVCSDSCANLLLFLLQTGLCWRGPLGAEKLRSPILSRVEFCGDLDR